MDGTEEPLRINTRNIQVFLDVTSCWLVNIYRRFGETWWPYVHGQVTKFGPFHSSWTAWTWRWGNQAPPESW